MDNFLWNMKSVIAKCHRRKRDSEERSAHTLYTATKRQTKNTHFTKKICEFKRLMCEQFFFFNSVDGYECMHPPHWTSQ